MSVEHRIAWLVGELARPLAILMTSGAASWASVVVAYRVKDGNDGYLFIGAVFVGVGALYIGKAVEVFKTNKSADQVAIAKVAAPAAESRSLEDPA